MADRAPANGEPAVGSGVPARATGLLFVLAFFPALGRDFLTFDARATLAIVQLDRNRPDTAIGELGAALGLAPDSALAHYHLARALGRTGQRAEADAHLQRARALDPRPGALAPTPGRTPHAGNPLPESGAGVTR